MSWIDYKQYRHPELLEQLRDTGLSEYDPMLDLYKVAESIKERYKQLPWPTEVDWHCHALIMGGRINQDYEPYWPQSTKFAATIPGLKSLNVNYVAAHSIIPDHCDDIKPLKQQESWRENLGIVTIIGIDMPSDNAEVVGFHVNNEKKSWPTGGIVSMNGSELHGGWNRTDKMRVTFYLAIDKEYYEMV